MHPADVLKELAARQRSIAKDVLLVRGRCCSFEDVVDLIKAPRCKLLLTVAVVARSKMWVDLIKAPRCKLLLTGLIGANNEDM